MTIYVTEGFRHLLWVVGIAASVRSINYEFAEGFEEVREGVEGESGDEV